MLLTIFPQRWHLKCHVSFTLNSGTTTTGLAFKTAIDNVSNCQCASTASEGLDQALPQYAERAISRFVAINNNAGVLESIQMVQPDVSAPVYNKNNNKNKLEIRPMTIGNRESVHCYIFSWSYYAGIVEDTASLTTSNFHTVSSCFSAPRLCVLLRMASIDIKYSIWFQQMQGQWQTSSGLTKSMLPVSCTLDACYPCKDIYCLLHHGQHYTIARYY